MKVIKKKIDCLEKLDGTSTYNASVVFEVRRFLGVIPIKRKMWVFCARSNFSNKIFYYLTGCESFKCKFETSSEAIKELENCIDRYLKEYAGKKVVSKKTINFD